MVAAAQNVERAGADFVLLCTNTMHKLADDIQAAIHIPFLHIADATARKIKGMGIRKVGLLGTRFTMEQDFYRLRLEEKHHLSVLIPGEQQREVVHRIIYQELCLGVIKEESRLQYTRVIQELVHSGAQGIILGCTEIELLVKPEDSPVQIFPTTRIHAEAAVDYALG
jgi:aspartate racemase